MKKLLNPTREQRTILERHGYDSKQWYIVKNMPNELEIISKVSVRKGLKKTKTIPK